MPQARNFNPEWGYLAPRPGFIRTVRMVFVAGAIGTVAGMAVAVALVARPAADVSVAARTMAQSSDSAVLPQSKVSAANAEFLEEQAHHVASPPPLPAPSSEDRRGLENLAAAESRSATTLQQPASVSGLAEAPAVRDNAAEARSEAPLMREKAAEARSEATPTPSPKRVSKKEQLARAPAPRSDQGSFEAATAGPFDLLPLIGRTILGANPFWNEQAK